MFSLDLDVSRWGDESVMYETFVDCRIKIEPISKEIKTIPVETNVKCLQSVSSSNYVRETDRVSGKITHWNYDRGFGFVEMEKSAKSKLFSNKSVNCVFNNTNYLSPNNISSKGINGIYLHISQIYPHEQMLVSKGKLISFVFHIDKIKKKPQAQWVQFI
jgi:cold shock CspA family protein